MAIFRVVTNISMSRVGAYIAFDPSQRESQRWIGALVLTLAVLALVWDRRRIFGLFRCSAPCIPQTRENTETPCGLGPHDGGVGQRGYFLMLQPGCQSSPTQHSAARSSPSLSRLRSSTNYSVECGLQRQDNRCALYR